MKKDKFENILPYFDVLRDKSDTLFLFYDTLFTKWLADKEEEKDFFNFYSAFIEMQQVQNEILFLLEVYTK